MPDPSKDFTPIRGDYEFFSTHSTEPDADLAAYAERLRSFDPPEGPVSFLDFGCGPGSFTAQFLGKASWGHDRVSLALVEPSDAYRQQAVERLRAATGRPVRAWAGLPDNVNGQFDVILSNHVLYYVPSLDDVLLRVVRALAPGGVFLAAVAGRDNALVDLWFRGFPLIGRPVPSQTAEDVEAALTRVGAEFESREVRYDLAFPDTGENRLKILRFLFGEHLAEMPTAEALTHFEPHVAGGQVEIHTASRQYYARGGP
jgi:trans-aconitate 2-methyltransferase